MIAVNLRAPIALTRMAAAAMAARGAGTIVNVASSAAIKAARRRGRLCRDQGRADRIHARGVRRVAPKRAQARGDRSGPGRYCADSEQQAARSHGDAFDGRRRPGRDADRELSCGRMPGRSDARTAARSGACRAEFRAFTRARLMSFTARFALVLAAGSRARSFSHRSRRSDYRLRDGASRFPEFSIGP